MLNVQCLENIDFLNIAKNRRKKSVKIRVAAGIRVIRVPSLRD